MSYTIIQGDNIDTLKQYPDDYFDSIVTDPPYGIAFLGKDWDNNTGAVETWQECLRVLKPGGYLLAFSAARTYHHLATNIEGVGFEIRAQLMWLYSSGFPKAVDLGKAIQKRQGVEETKPQAGTNAFKKDGGMSFGHNNKFGDKKAEVIPTSPEALQWSGWKTALKPGHEPIVMARKPFKGSTIDNVLEHGVGALNIDATRVGDEVREFKDIVAIRETSQYAGKSNNGKEGNGFNYQPLGDKTYVGRYPSNVMGDIPDYQKYFYSPKVSRAERHIGFDTANIPQMGSTHPDDIKKHPLWDPSIGGDAARLKRKIDEAGEYKGNNHPTVKPVELMKYLIKLVTPPKGTVLDPFTGSGSTGMAAVELGYDFVGCELDQAYVDIANRRIEGWNKPVNNYHDLFEDE